MFRIRRPFANINPVDNVFEISGDQDNGGVEFSAVGQLVDGLTIYGGLTLLDARMQHTPLVSTDDKLYVGAPKQKGNVLLEYQIPNVPGLVASFDYQFSGERAGNDTNSFMVTGYNLFDVGVRYAVEPGHAHLAARGGQPGQPRLLVDDRAERSHRHEYRQPDRLPGIAAHRAGVRHRRPVSRRRAPPGGARGRRVLLRTALERDTVRWCAPSG